MRTYVFLAICIVALLVAFSALADTTTSFSCPAGYAMTVDPPPAPKDDPPKQEEYKPKTSTEKQADAAKEQADQFARTHCIRLEQRQ